MLSKQIDILTIGDLTTDAFIRLKDAHIHCRVDKENSELCLPFGDKVPFEYVKVIKAVGNAGNAAVAAARLGLKTAIVSDVGNDQNGTDCINELQRNKVVTSFIKTNNNRPTNYHFVLWYDVDRTILVNHTEFDYHLPKSFSNHPSAKMYSTNGIPPKWVYFTSLGSSSHPYQLTVADYLEANPSIKLAFQPGTFQIKLGHEHLKRIYARADVLIINKEEAHTILNANTEDRDIKSLLKSIAALGPKLTVITDGTNGAYLYDLDHFYHMPIYPDPRPPFERTGCGDAWASTFVSALVMGKTPLEALTWAPVNPMSVAQFVGSQEGLLSLDDLTWWLNRAPAEYKPKEI